MSFTSSVSRIKAGAQPFSQPTTIPAPVKGWNARDELDAMDPLDAITLDNFFPDVTGITVRNGFASYATGMGAAPVKTIAEYLNGSTNKLLAACNGSIFDISSAGAVGAALGTGFGSDAWQTTNFLGKMFLANGADTMQTYDGSSLANSTFSGVTLSTLIGVYQYQQRLFFWTAHSSTFYYAPLNAITGALQSYDLSPFSPRGGNIVAITTISHDGGNGVLDFIAFILSTGDMLVFYGNDPGLSTNWQMIARYRVSPPVNIRAVAQYGGDSFVATYDDYMPLQQQLVALKVGQLPPRSKVSGAVQAAIAANPSGFGWQGLYYPKGRRLIFNVPNPDGTTFVQHVCNTALPTQPWCRFIDMNAYCWGLYGTGLYFGGANGVAYVADTGSDDNGAVISATAQQAWDKSDSSFRKRMTVVRPIVQSNQGSYNFSVGFDYEAFAIPEAVDLDGADLTDDAGNAITGNSGVNITVGVAGISPQWQFIGGTGTSYSFGMNINSVGQTSWLRTDYRMEAGTAL